MLIPALLTALTPSFVSQDPVSRDTSAESVPTADLDASHVAALPWRELGPTIFGGRIVDIAAHPDRPHTLWIAGASGGLWRTTDHGTTWECLFEDEASLSIGDIAVDPSDPERLWIGSGEANNQRSSYWGDGVYRSTDGGATWENVGLTDSHHIGRIVVDPTDSEKVFVAALGHLYTPNEERGLYRTSDGGETWECVLHVNSDVGVVDVAIDPSDPDRLVAATYERRRRAWDFDGAGPGSGIWRSLDGGDSWERCEGGLPTGDIGRIGVDVFPADPRFVVATVSNQNEEEVQEGPIVGLEVEWRDGDLVVTRVARRSTAAELGIEDDDVLEKIGDDELDSPFAWLAVLDGLGDVEDDDEAITLTLRRGDEAVEVEATLADLVAARDREPRTREIGGEVYLSADFGETWEKRNVDPAGGSPAYYYGQIRFDPKDRDRMYMCGVPMLASSDGGMNWERIAGSVHVDHHSLLIDPEDTDKIWLGNDGGLHLSWDRGETWRHYNNVPLSQFYAVGLDTSEPFRVFGGTQDNGTWGGPHTSRDPRGIHPIEWFRVGGGDGFYAQIDPRNPDTVYAESQFGAIYRRDLRTGTSVSIRPRKPEGAEEDRLRFNWNSPILVSKHNPEVVYFGGNRVFKSFDRGDTWSVHSPDLTTNDAEKIAGNVPHCTVTTIDESALDPGLLIAGSDDGLVHMSEDGGYTWTNLTGQFPGAPSNWWVSRVALSTENRNTAYVSFTGYREDDFRPFLYRTDELGSGKGWRRIAGGLPRNEPINDVVEDPTNPDVLYVGTEFGVYVSVDGGGIWAELGSGLPRVAVHDLAVHERDGVLVAATHGRGFQALEIDAVRAMGPESLARPAHLYPVGDVVRWARRSAVGGYGGGDQTWYGENETSNVVLVVQKAEDAPALQVSIHDDRGRRLASIDVPDEAGVHRLTWSGRSGSGRRFSRAREGEYEARLVAKPAEGEDAGEPITTQSFRIRRDPLLENATAAEMENEELGDPVEDR